MKFGLYLLLTLLFLSSAATNAEMVTDKNKTILAIFAHPDDEGMVSALLSKYAREDVDVRLAIVTDGRFGVQPHAKIPAGEKLIEVRKKEALCATKALKISPPIFLDYVDGLLSKRDEIIRLEQDVARLFSEIKPDVVITWGPDGGYGHPDHRLVGSVVTEVFQRGGDNWPDMVFYPATPEVQMNNFDTKSRFGMFIQQQWGVTKQDYLPYRIAIEQGDLDRGIKSFSCYKSQFSAVAMEDFSNFMSQSKGLAYLRPSHTKSSHKDSLF